MREGERRPGKEREASIAHLGIILELVRVVLSAKGRNFVGRVAGAEENLAQYKLLCGQFSNQVLRFVSVDALIL